MRIFDVNVDHLRDQCFDRLVANITALIQDICRSMKLPLQVMHIAMWVLHCHARIASYRKFDRFICSCASILIATKVGEALRNTTDIIKHMRVILRAKKQISAEDSEDSLARYARKVFEAEIHIMINLGFDFDIETGLASLPEIYEEVKEQHLLEKVRAALTSLYKTNVVIYFSPRHLTFCALNIVFLAEGIQASVGNYSAGFQQLLQSQQVKQIKEMYLLKCTANDANYGANNCVNDWGNN